MPTAPRGRGAARRLATCVSCGIPESGADGARGVDDFAGGIHVFHFFEGFVEGDRFDLARFQADHTAKLMFGGEVRGRNAEACAEDAVEGSGRAAALDVSENGDANFLVEHFTKGEGDGVGNVARAGRRNGLAAGVRGGELDAFGDDDEAEAFAAEFPGAHGVADMFEFEGNFGDKDNVRAAGDSSVQGDPACVAAHDFDEHDAVMGFGGSVEAVDCLRGDDEGGVETEGDFRGIEVVVDGLGYADDV